MRIVEQYYETLCPNVLSWGDLYVLSDFLSTTRWRPTFTDSVYLGFDGVMPHHNCPTRLRLAKRQLGSERALLACLVHARSHDCTELIDKVFSLYGVAATYHAPGITRPKANYHLPFHEAYTETAKYILMSSDDLQILVNAEGRKFQSVPLLPFWVPDWSVKMSVGFKTGHRRYWAASNLPKTKVGLPEPRVLRLKAAYLSQITACADSKREITKARNMATALRLLDDLGEQYTGEPILEALWQTFLYDTGPDRKCPAPSDLTPSALDPWSELAERSLSVRNMPEISKTYKHLPRVMRRVLYTSTRASDFEPA